MKQYKLVMLLALLTVLPAMAEAKLVEYEFDINSLIREERLQIEFEELYEK